MWNNLTMKKKDKRKLGFWGLCLSGCYLIPFGFIRFFDDNTNPILCLIMVVIGIIILILSFKNI